MRNLRLGNGSTQKSTELPAATGTPRQTHVLAPSDCGLDGLSRLLVLGFSLRSAAPNWRAHAMLSSCNARNKRLAPLLAQLHASFNVSQHRKFTPSGVTTRYMLKPWLLHQWASTFQERYIDVVIVDNDMVILAPGSIPHYHTAQEYRYGSGWLTKVCSGPAGICPNMTHALARSHYMIGVPYVLPVAQFRRIAASWFHYHTRVLDIMGTGDILADQYAYALAAFHAGQRPTQVRSMMVSNAHIDVEAWSVVATKVKGWRKADGNIPPTPCSQLAEPSLHKTSGLPMFLHACQEYVACADGGRPPCVRKTDRWSFYKRDGKESIVFSSCSAQSLLAAPPEDLFSVQNTSVTKRMAFMVCALTHTYNNAAREMCSNRNQTVELLPTCSFPTQPAQQSPAANLARAVSGMRWSWEGVEGMRFEAGGTLITPWGAGTWGAAGTRPDVLVAEFAQNRHMLTFAACSGGPRFISTRCADGEEVRGVALDKSKVIDADWAATNIATTPAVCS